MTRRDLLHRLLAITLSVALSLVAFEVLLRLALPGRRFVNTAVRPVVSAPDFGQPELRGRRWPGPKAAGVFRIVVLGDSFSLGSGVHPSDPYPIRLEGRLARLESARDFEVVNWSRSGWNTRQAVESVAGHLVELAPDLVLLNFTLNDPQPSARAAVNRLTQPLHRRTPDAWLSRALHRYSAVYRLFWERLENLRQRRVYDAYYEGLFEGPDWLDCLAAMKGLRQATDTIGAPLVLVVMPVFDSQLDSSYSYRPLHRRIGEAAKELDIPVVDLLLTFRRVDARRLAVTPFTDPHPSELAHRIAADELTNYLLDEGLVPASYAANQRRIEAVRRR